MHIGSRETDHARKRPCKFDFIMLAIAPGVDDRSWGAFWQLSCPVFKAVRERYNAQFRKRR